MKELMQDIQKARVTLGTLGPIFAKDDDVHKHTRTIGPLAKELMLIDENYKFSAVAQPNFEATAAEILAYSQNDPIVALMLNNIRANGTRLDHETGLNIQEQLIRTWTLAKTVRYAEPKDMVIDNIKHNAKTGGGCLPGISARLVQPYANFVLAALEGLAVKGYDDDLELALAMSKAESAKDDDLEKAIALSKKAYTGVQAKKTSLTWGYSAVASTSSSSSQSNRADDEFERAIALSKHTFAAEQAKVRSVSASQTELSDDDIMQVALALSRSKK